MGRAVIVSDPRVVECSGNNDIVEDKLQFCFPGHNSSYQHVLLYIDLNGCLN